MDGDDSESHDHLVDGIDVLIATLVVIGGMMVLIAIALNLGGGSP